MRTVLMLQECGENGASVVLNMAKVAKLGLVPASITEILRQ